jgi:hypothetical protein
MDHRLLEGVLRLAATGLFVIGVVFFGVSLLFGVPMFMEGVTHREGEGNIARAETPEESQRRLAFVGGLFALAAVGWMLARVGDVYRMPGMARRRFWPARLLAELLLVLGGFGLGIGILVAWGNREAAYQVGDDYNRVGMVGGIAGPILLAVGTALYWLVRTKAPAKIVVLAPEGRQNKAPGDNPGAEW